MCGLSKHPVKTLHVVLVLVLSFGGSLKAEDHVVSPAELRAGAIAAGDARQDSIRKLENFFTTEPVRKALRQKRMDSAQVAGAVSFLSDAELARLAARAQAVENDIAAGALTNQQLTYIVIALATAVIILVIVAR